MKKINIIIERTAKSVTKLLNLSGRHIWCWIPTSSYRFYSDVTFSCKHKDVVTKAVVALFTMAESEESVPSVSAPSSNSFLAVSTPLESAASTSNVSGVSSRSEMLSKLCFTKLLPVPSQSHVTLIGVVTTESIERFRRKWFFYRVTLLRKLNPAYDLDEGL